jgi:hypothetical protein
MSFNTASVVCVIDPEPPPSPTKASPTSLLHRPPALGTLERVRFAHVVTLNRSKLQLNMC